MLASDRWATLSPRYRADREPVLLYIREKIGKCDVSRLRQADIYDAMDANKHRVRFANYLPVAISLICKVIVRRRWLSDNPARGIELLQVPKIRRKPHLPWTDTAVAKFRAEAQPLPRLIFEIGVGSVQRPATGSISPGVTMTETAFGFGRIRRTSRSCCRAPMP